MLLGIGNKKQSGKDLAAKIIIVDKLRDSFFPTGSIKPDTLEEFYDAERDFITSISGIEIKKFATKLKEVVSVISGCHLHELEDNTFKKGKFPFLTDKKEQITYREALQYVGTDLFRNSFPQIWVDALFLNYNPSKKWIITDVRFKNEAEKIRNLGGKLLNIKRKNDNTDTHPSETELDDYDWDYVIENNGGIQDLINNIRSISPLI